MQKTSTQDQEMNAPCAQGGNLVVARGTSPSPHNNTSRSTEQSNAPQSPTSPQNKIEYHDFLQVPHIILDSNMHESYLLGFIRLWRRCWQRGVYVGSIRKLCKLLNMSKNTIWRAIAEWTRVGWVKKDVQRREDDQREDMRLCLCVNEIWKLNEARYLARKEQENTVPVWDTDVPEMTTSVPQLTTSVPNWDNTVPQLTTSVPNLTVTVPPASTKQGGNIGNISLNTNKNTGNREGNIPTSAKTEPLPSLPPSSPSFSENKLKETVSPIRKGVITLSEKHLAPRSRKETDMDIQTALSEMERRFTSIAQLVSEEEALRQCEIALLYMKYADDFWKTRQEFLTLVKAEKQIDSMLSKSKNWTIPSDLPRLYPDPVLPAPVAPVQETKTEPLSFVSTQDNQLEGMTMEEAEALDAKLTERYPGIEISYGELPGKRYTVGVRCGSGDEDWIELFKASDWYQATGFRRKRIERAMAYYRLTHPQTEEIQRLAVAV